MRRLLHAIGREVGGFEGDLVSREEIAEALDVQITNYRAKRREEAPASEPWEEMEAAAQAARVALLGAELPPTTEKPTEVPSEDEEQHEDDELREIDRQLAEAELQFVSQKIESITKG